MKLTRYGADFQYSVTSGTPSDRASRCTARNESMSRSITRTSGHATSLSIPLRSGVTASRSVRTITRRSMLATSSLARRSGSQPSVPMRNNSLPYVASAP